MLTSPRELLRLLVLKAISPALSPPPLGHVPRRLLLIRPDHFGDVLLTSPAVAGIREALPRYHLTFLVGPWSAEAARRGADVDEVATLAFPGFTRQPKPNPLQPYRLLLKQAAGLRDRFDMAVVFRPDHWWGALLALSARIPLRVGFSLPAMKPLLTDGLPFWPGLHAAELTLALAARVSELAGGEPIADHGGSPRRSPTDSWKPVFRISADERAWARARAEQPGRPLVVLHPGSGSPLKDWPPARWARLADAILERGFAVALTGGRDELQATQAVESGMHGAPIMLAGCTTLGQLGALFEHCALVVGGDNGPLHLAAALGAPTLRLYGPTDERVFGPWPRSARHSILTHPLPCRPCGKLLAPPCAARREPPCLLGIRPELALEATLGRLETLPVSSPA